MIEPIRPKAILPKPPQQEEGSFTAEEVVVVFQRTVIAVELVFEDEANCQTNAEVFPVPLKPKREPDCIPDSIENLSTESTP